MDASKDKGVGLTTLIDAKYIQHMNEVLAATKQTLAAVQKQRKEKRAKVMEKARIKAKALVKEKTLGRNRIRNGVIRNRFGMELRKTSQRRSTRRRSGD